MNFPQAAGLYKLGVLPSEKMVDVAMAALESGAEEEQILMLAIETDKTLGNLKPLFEACLKLLNLDSLTNQKALEYAAEYYASLAKAGNISEIEFGFKLGFFHEEYKLHGDLWDAYQYAMWFEESPYEWGYPKDIESLRALREKCSSTIWEIINKYAA